MAILCGAAKTSLRGTGAPFQKVHAFQKGHPLSHLSGKVGHALPKGVSPSKRGAPFPIHQTVYQELRMDGGIAKPGPACKT